MYLCICHKISEKDLIEKLNQCSAPQEAIKKLGLGQSCGICLLDACTKAGIDLTSLNAHGKKAKK